MSAPMKTILVAADAPWLRSHVRAAIESPDREVVEVAEGRKVRDLVADTDVDLVVVDMQIGSMGGIAVAVDLRLEASADRAPWVPILLLLDRQADEFLGRRSGIDASILKPLDASTLRRTIERLLTLGASTPSTPGLSAGEG